MRRYILAPEAQADLKEINAYLKHEAGIRVAQSTMKRLRAAITFLGQTPGAGHVREDLTDAPVKFWPVFSYLIIYNPATQPVEIVRVVHGSREISAILSQDD